MVKAIITFIAILSIVLFMSLPGIYTLVTVSKRVHVVCNAVADHNEQIRAELEDIIQPD